MSPLGSAHRPTSGRSLGGPRGRLSRARHLSACVVGAVATVLLLSLVLPDSARGILTIYGVGDRFRAQVRVVKAGDRVQLKRQILTKWIQVEGPTVGLTEVPGSPDKSVWEAFDAPQPTTGSSYRITFALQGKTPEGAQAILDYESIHVLSTGAASAKLSGGSHPELIRQIAEAVSGNRVFVAAIKNAEFHVDGDGSDDGEIWLMSGRKYGSAVQSQRAVRVDERGGGPYQTVRVAATGRATYVAWWDPKAKVVKLTTLDPDGNLVVAAHTVPGTGEAGQLDFGNFELEATPSGVYLVWVSASDRTCRFVHSTDNGATFGDAIEIGDAGDWATLATASAETSDCVVAVFGGIGCVKAASLRAGALAGTSPLGGPIGDAGIRQNWVTDLSPDGSNACVAWTDSVVTRTDPGSGAEVRQAQVKSATSNDGGVSWNAVQAVSAAHGDDYVYDLTLATGATGSNVVWNQTWGWSKGNGESDAFCARSRFDGVFVAPSKLGIWVSSVAVTPPKPGRPEALCVTGGMRSGGSSRVVLRLSWDGGQTFSPAKPVPCFAANAATSKFPVELWGAPA